MTDENAAEEEWRFPLSDFEEDGDAGKDGTRSSASDAEEPEAAAGTPGDRAGAERAGAGTIEPGDPSLEGTVFVLLGMAFALFVISRPLVG